MTIKFTAQNFGCLKNFEIDLQPLHALIGPNDSGKSTVLRALFDAGRRSHINLTADDYVGYVGANTRLQIAKGQEQYSIALRPDGTAQLLDARKSIPFGPNRVPAHLKLPVPLLIRLDPDEMRAPVHLIPHKEPLAFINERGAGLAGIYDALIKRDVPTYLDISRRICDLFPSVHSLQLTNVDANLQMLAVKLTSGETIDANAMSEGMLYYLAFAALPHIGGHRLVLIEEPENGLHPARIKEVMNVLKEVSKTSQVVIATHSPLVINELEPEQVSIITRDPESGTKATKMTDTKDFAERSSVFALGELWLSFADGEMEKNLVPEVKAQ